MKKRVGILTFSWGNNYGAVLQCYALIQKLEKFGYDVIVIDRRPDFSLKNLLYEKIDDKLFANSFVDFREQYFQSTDVIRKNSVLRSDVSKYDFYAIVVGSDQVWRPEYTKVFGLEYYLDFVNGKERKISYAASFGKDTISLDGNTITQIRKELRTFNAISVREDSGVQICEKYFGVRADHVLDPTLLLDMDKYNEVIGDNGLSQGHFISYYFLDPNTVKKKILQRLKALLSVDEIKNIYIENTSQSLIKKLLTSSCQSKYPTVSSWLKNIRDSSFFVTDSFHGVAFSIIFRKQFICIVNKERGASRMESLLNSLGLGDRLIYEEDEFSFDTYPEIDYSLVYLKLEGLRKISNYFLSNSLQNEA